MFIIHLPKTKKGCNYPGLYLVYRKTKACTFALIYRRNARGFKVFNSMFVRALFITRL